MLSLPLKIKIEMLKKGVTGGDIGRRIGVTRAAVNMVINGTFRSRRIRKAIADAIEIEYTDLWGEDKRVA